MTEPTTLRTRAQALRLHGLLAHWSTVAAAPWLPELLQWEEQERARRRLERRLKAAQIGRFKPLCDFDWAWPKRCDQATIAALMTLDFLKEATNVVRQGPNGVGKTTLARNLPTRPCSRGIPCALPAPEPCSATSPPSTATPCCAAGCATMPPRNCWSLTYGKT